MTETTTRHWAKRIGRLQIRLTVHRHVYVMDMGERWVFQPCLIWDRQ